jgi:hypothetical protein
MKNKKYRKLADKKFTDVVRAVEKKLSTQPMGQGRYDVLTDMEYLALHQLQAAAVVCCRAALLNPLEKMPFSFVYRGHKYGLEYSSVGRVFICFLPGGDAFISSAFFALWNIKNDKA